MPAPIVRPLEEADWTDVLRIYGEGIATGNATFQTDVPTAQELASKWLADHQWAAESGGEVVGWAALSPTSTRECYAGVVETSVYVGANARGLGVGKALLHKQTSAADTARLWTLQNSIFPENEASLALHEAFGFRIVGTRERIALLHGVWRDTILLERRSPAI